MEERSLRVYSDKTFFTKITSTISKMLIPTKIGINGMLISIKRNNLLKAYEHYEQDKQNAERKEEIEKKYEDMYSLYLEAIDKHIMDSIYKKVKNDTASDFEKDALAKYYEIIHIKENEYLEYKYIKQKYLLNLDYETVKSLEKTKLLERYKKMYLSKVESLYKGLLKHYSVKLADNLSYQDKDTIYEKIFMTLEEYIINILPLKMEQNKENTMYQEILSEYDKFESFTVGKLDQNDGIEKRMLLLAISRKLFTHSLPLIVAEQCYIKLLKDTRSLIVDTKVARKKEKAYSLLIRLIDDYNIKLLSTKIYWDRPKEREEYQKFWNQYKEIEKLKEKDYLQYRTQKEILFVKADLQKISKNENKYFKVIQFYKAKLVELGAMRELKNSYISNKNYTGKKHLQKLLER